ncbi:MAG TPA: hypothetical protein DCR77_07975 [Flavobacteriaceae bacterium]|nr:hypothetical protein [Flavobacteriaceae bacterium]
MKKGSDIIVYVVGILFTIGSLLIFIISYKKDRLSEVVQEPKSYLGLGFGLMAICYYLLKSKKKLNSNDATIKKTKVIATLIMSVLFVNAGLFILFSDINYNRYIPNELIKYIVGCLAIIFFGGIMIISLRTLWIIYFKKLKFYYFENDSFNFYNPLNSRYIKIPIQEIEKFDSINYFNNDFILIIVEDEGNYLNRLEKFLAKFNKRNFGTYYCFNLNTTNLDEQKALKDLNKELNTLKN